METLCEIKMSTDSEFVHPAGGGIYHMNLHQTLPIPENAKLSLAVKGDIKVPEEERVLQFKLYFGSKHDVINENSLKTHTVHFRNFDEFCGEFEAIANSELSIDRKLTVDFSYPADQYHNHYYFNLTSVNSTLSIKYQNSKFHLAKHMDLMLVVSANVAEMMGFDMKDEDEEVEISTLPIVKLMKTHYISKRRCLFRAAEDERLICVLFEKIDSFAVMKNGMRCPILFEYDVKSSEKCSSLICVRRLTVNKLNEFCFGFYREDMSPFMPYCDLRVNPLQFNMVILIS